jgi:hypothetical protein
MFRARVLLGLVVAAALVAGSIYGQDAKAKVKLPKGWSKLALSEDQKKQVATIRSKFGPQIQELQTKLQELRKQEETELNRLLTADQRKTLREIALKNVPPDEDAKDTKKDK